MSSKACAPGCDCRRHSPEVRARQSAWSKAQRHSPETRARIGAGVRANSGLRGRFGPDSPTWKGDGAGVHHRLTRDRGPARDHACSDCGGRAAEWSYQGGAPDELPGSGGPESRDLDVYAPRCVPCHRLYDSPLHPRRAV